jgi:hypothetical protein
MVAGNAEAAAKPGCMLGILFGAVIGGSCAGLLFVTGFNLTWNLKSSDFLGAVLSALGVMLAAVSVLLALLALALAGGAIYGWRDFKRRTGETAAQKAAAVAGPAAVEVAVPAAIEQVDKYLDKNLAPEIRQKVIAVVGQIVTPELIREIAKQDDREAAGREAVEVRLTEDFPQIALEAAAVEELERQEQTMEEFDATVEAEKLRGDDRRPQEDDL